MRCTIIRPDGDLKQEKWEFNLVVDTRPRIYFDYYAFSTRLSTRHNKWHRQNYWSRLFNRESTLKTPPNIPPDVKEEMYSYFKEAIAKLPIEN